MATCFSVGVKPSGAGGRNPIRESLRLLSRAIFVVGPDNRVDYVEYVEELADHPDYEAVLGAVRQAA